MPFTGPMTVPLSGRTGEPSTVNRPRMMSAAICG